MSLATAPLLERLRRAETFGAAAELLLQPILAGTRGALGARPGAAVLRAMVHLRAEGGYAGLHVTEADGTTSDGATPVPSATAWQRLCEVGHPLVVDVEARSTWRMDGTQLAQDSGAWGQSRAAIQARSVTHLGLWPLHAPGGSRIGMVSVEVRAPTQIGIGLGCWQSDADAIARAADLAAPYLAGLPRPQDPVPLRDPLLPVVGDQMAPIVATLEAFAAFDETLLLRGATGTGKSHLARWCHGRSSRAQGPFEVAQLHAVASALQSGELFGWVKGAFTGAVRNHRGWVERAEGGSLFLDEVDKLDLETQAKLLNLLEERRYKPVGSETTRRADVRFLVGTNANLETEVREGRFLRDLYYRINVLPVELPTLRERADEIGAWAGWMARQLHRKRGGRGRVALDPAAEQALLAYPWPGNLRQLQSVVVRAYAFAGLGGQGSTSAVVLGADHVKRALGFEGGLSDQGSLAIQLGRAAESFVDLALQQRDAGTPLDLELAEAFPGFVLDAAVQRMGGERAAFLLFGLEARLKGGNHLKTLRRERQRVEALQAAIDGETQGES